MSAWGFYLGPPAPSGGFDREMASARGRKMTWRLGAPDEFAFTLDGRDGNALYIDELATDLYVARMHASGTRQLLGRGRIGTSGDDLDSTTGRHDCSFTAQSYRAVLSRRLLYSGNQLTWTAQDQAMVGYGLIAQTQAMPGGDLGIVPGQYGGGTGRLRDRTYEAGGNIGDLLQQLSEVIDGFDWDITAVDPMRLAFDIWYPQRGQHRGVLEYGGRISGLKRQVNPAEFANAGIFTGQAPDGGGDAPAPVERTGTIGPEGRFDKTFGTDIVLAGSLAERAEWQIDESEVVRPTYAVTLKAGTWTGPDDLWIGDTVRLRVKSGRLAVDTDYRIHELSVSLDDDTGDEAVELTLGGPKPDIRRRATEVERRLLNLERR